MFSHFSMVFLAFEGFRDVLLMMSRSSKFDEKLGIKESVDTLSLRAFGIRPSELGDNIFYNKILH